MKTTKDDDAGGSRAASSNAAADPQSSGLAATPEPNNSTIGWRGGLVLFLGWILPQLLLVGPAIVGTKTLVPWDLLTLPRFYSPAHQSTENPRPVDFALTDLILVDLPARDFCLHEFRSGRLPLWQPDNFLGAPFTAWPKYSPFEIPYWIWPCQQALAWNRLLQALCVGTGAWMFLRQAVGLSFWSATAGSWCWPLIGFVTLWQGFPLTGSLVWFPWLLVSIHFSVRRPFGWASIGTAITSGLTILSGQPDIGGLVLLGSGFYAVSRLFAEYRSQVLNWLKSGLSLSVAWALGLMLAAPYWMPLIEYARSGVRLQDRLSGFEERPPTGLAALVLVICPDAMGNTRQGSIYIGTGGNLLESSAGAFAGLIAALWLAPYAFTDRSRRSQIWFWAILGLFGIAWPVGIPGLVNLMRCSPFNTLSYNRAVFLTAISIVVLASIGLEQLMSAKRHFHIWLLIPLIVSLACLVGFCSMTIELPEIIRKDLPEAVRSGHETRFSRDDVLKIQRSFFECYAKTTFVCLAAFGGWIWTFYNKRSSRWIVTFAIVAMVGELTWFASQESRLRSWQPYFRHIPALDRLATMTNDRIWGVRCFPPNLNQTHGLKDVRGYDAVDPEPVVQLLRLSSDPRYRSVDYAKTRDMVPALIPVGNRTMVHPIVHLLNIRYFLTHSHSGVSLPFTVVLQEGDVSICENPDALPRAFVPKSVRRVAESEIIDMMDRIDFDPSQVAYVSEDMDVPDECRGTVVIRDVSAVELELSAEMETDGVVVTSDMWTSDWTATLDGMPTKIIKIDYALRGIKVPAGSHTVQMRYQPASVRTGFQLCLVSLLVLAGLSVRALYSHGTAF